MLELWEMWSAPLLPSLLGPLWPSGSNRTKLYLCETELFKIEWFISIKIDLALNNLLWLICHKAEPKQPPHTPTHRVPHIYLKKEICLFFHSPMLQWTF